MENTFEAYKSAVMDFISETKNWDSLDDRKYYTNNGYHWAETSDNACGGLDLSQFFHAENVTEQDIKTAYIEEVNMQIDLLKEMKNEDFEFYNNLIIEYQKELSVI